LNNRWDGKGLNGPSKAIFDVLDDLVTNTIKELVLQGKIDIIEDFRDLWRETFNSWLTETTWGKNGYIPSMDEYLETGMISIATHVLVLSASCFLNLPKSKVKPQKYESVTESLMATARLLNDIQSYKKEQEEGKMNLVLLHFKDNPNASLDDSVAEVQRFLERKRQELIAHIFTDDNDAELQYDIERAIYIPPQYELSYYLRNETNVRPLSEKRNLKISARYTQTPLCLNGHSRTNISVRTLPKKDEWEWGFVDDLNGDMFPPISVQDRVNVIGGNHDCLDQGLTNNGKRNEGFVDDPNGDQFPTISAHYRFDDLGEINDCLDQDIGDKGNRNVEYEKSANRSDDNAMTDNKIDNKLMEISTKISKNGNKVVVLNDEMIESGCEKWKNTICGFFVGGKVTYSEDERAWSIKGISALASSVGKPIIIDDMTVRICVKEEGMINFARVLIEVEAGKGLKKEIEVVYKGNINHEKITKIIKVEYAWKPPCYNKCKDKSMRNSSGESDLNRSNKEGINVVHEDIMDMSKRKSILNESNGKCSMEMSNSAVNKVDVSTYNRYTLLNELVGDQDLILSIEQRKIVDNYINKENEGDNIDS
nr:(E,E)-geranyllinalool synthase [Tanacetum cinerariifolium]